MKMRNTTLFFAVVATGMMFQSCTTDKNAPGVEYMPDMYRSPAVEAYIDYGNNQNMDRIDRRKDSSWVRLSMTPPKGTIPFGGELPYFLNNTIEDYERAALEVHSPLASTMANIEAGKAIYTKMCKHCHGDAGKGDGKISQNGFINGIPDYTTKLKDLQEGKMFHTITYGKGLMGRHEQLLTQHERWQVIEWVKCLQKGITAPTYDGTGKDAKLIIPAAAAVAAPADTTAKKG